MTKLHLLCEGIIVTRHLSNTAVTAGKLASVAAGQEAWQPLPLQNGWVNYGGGFGDASCMKDSLGYVHLKGLVRDGAHPAVIATLPPGYRPPNTILLSLLKNSDGTNVRAYIRTDGSIEANGASGSVAYCSLDSITFRAA